MRFGLRELPTQFLDLELFLYIVLLFTFLFLLFPTFCDKFLLSHTIFCFQVLGFFASFGFVSNIPRTHRDAPRPPHDFLLPNFKFVVEF